MKHELTTGEEMILVKFGNTLYHEGGYDFDQMISAYYWSPSETKEDRGYLSSLVKKGYMEVENFIKKDSTAWFTEKGLAAFMERQTIK